jgi:hypothetical protein
LLTKKTPTFLNYSRHPRVFQEFRREGKDGQELKIFNPYGAALQEAAEKPGKTYSWAA